MAKNLLAVPAANAFIERQFSIAKSFKTDARNRLSNNTFRQLVLLNSWLKINKTNK